MKYGDSIKREIYEDTYNKMKSLGLSSILYSPDLVEKRVLIKRELISYYEGTEEFEKCDFIKRFFSKLDKDVGISSLISGLGKENAK